MRFRPSGRPKLLSSVSNGMGRTLSFTYTNGKLTKVSNGTASASYSYDSAGKLLTGFTDPMSKATAFAYDSGRRLTTITYPSFPSTPFVTNVYDTLGRVMTQTDALGNRWTYLFANGYRSQEIDPVGGSRVLYYDRNGNHIRDTDQVGDTTQFAYDGIGRPIKTTYPPGRLGGAGLRRRLQSGEADDEPDPGRDRYRDRPAGGADRRELDL
ncbi:hypothetical protein KXR53_30605 [Inquilinus limosus]